MSTDDEMLTFDELFDPDLLRSFQHCRIRARRAVRGGRIGEQFSLGRGQGIDFNDYRPYAVGDDLRTVDWHIYRRLGTLFVKVFEEEKDLPLYLLPDVSASMYMEKPPRIRFALRVALALASISLNKGDSVTVFPFGEALQVNGKSRSGRSKIVQIAHEMAALKSYGSSNLSGAVRQFSRLSLRQGLLVLISDFFDPGGVEALTSALSFCHHRMLFIQLVRESDGIPDLRGGYRLKDCETGAELEVLVNKAVLTRYQDAYAIFNEELSALANEHHAGHLIFDVDKNEVAQLSDLFQAGCLYV